MLTADKILKTIDQAKFDAIRSKYSDDGAVGSPAKYLDLHLWIGINLQRASSIGIEDVRGTPNSKRVLDIGCGAGYFLHICRMLGHDVLGIDRQMNGGMFVELTDLLDVPVVAMSVTPFVRLALVGVFDVITAHMVTFNGHRTKPWGIAEWSFFLDDAKERLAKGGVICLELNREPDINACYTPELRRFFEARGAVITGHYPYNREADGHRLVFRP